MVALNDVLKIKTQKLSLALVADFQLCRFCRVVDQDNKRIRVGYECPVCGHAGKGGMMFFEVSIHTLVNLMQEAFHSTSNLHGKPSESDSHNVSVVLFFCTIREILLNSLISDLCWAQSIPKRVYERLLSDNVTYKQRQEKLLRTLIGKKWATLLREENAVGEIDCISLNDFLKKAADARNDFMHEGKKWDISRELAEDCIRNLNPLLKFYVALHNRYVHPMFLKR